MMQTSYGWRGRDKPVRWVLLGAAVLAGASCTHTPETDDVITEQDAEALRRYAATFEVDIRATKDSPYATAHFVGSDECSEKLGDAVIRVNGVRLNGASSSAPCTPYSYGASVPRAEDHRYVFEVSYGSSYFSRTVIAEPVRFTRPEPRAEIDAHESFAVAWDRQLEDAEVSAAKCVYTRYAEEVGDTSATFRSLRLADPAPCTAHVTLRFGGSEPMAEPFRSGTRRYYITQQLPIRVTR